MTSPHLHGARVAARVLLLACVLAAPSAYAQSEITCTASNVTIDFGPYDVLAGTVLPGAGTLSVTCTNASAQRQTVSYSVALSTSPTRLMAPPSGSDRISYGLFVDNAHTLSWGDGTGGTSTIAGGPVTINNNKSVTDTPVSFYGLISPGGQDVSAASPGPAPTTYSQTLTITVTCTPSPPC